MSPRGLLPPIRVVSRRNLATHPLLHARLEHHHQGHNRFFRFWIVGIGEVMGVEGAEIALDAREYDDEVSQISGHFTCASLSVAFAVVSFPLVASKWPIDNCPAHNYRHNRCDQEYIDATAEAVAPYRPESSQTSTNVCRQ